MAVRSPDLPRQLAKEIASAISFDGYASTVFCNAHNDSIFLSAHEFLADDADWNAEEWSFTSGGITRILGTVKLICDLLPPAFTFEASWAGDKSERDEALTRTELLELIEANRIRNRVRYRLPSAGGLHRLADHVRVRRDRDHPPGPWPAEPTGHIRRHPLGEGVHLIVPGRRWPHLMWFVVFDQPQTDADGDGPYINSEVNGIYLEKV